MRLREDVPLVERERELDALDDARRGARRRGRGRAGQGEAGIGKSQLLTAARSAASGFEVLTARASELERDFPFGLVRQLLEPPLATAAGADRTELLSGAAALAERVLAPEAAGQAVAGDPSFGALHGLDGSLPTWPHGGPFSRSSTICTGPTCLRCAGCSIWPSGSMALRSRWSWPRGSASPAPRAIS